jgi:hypothetical protein
LISSSLGQYWLPHKFSLPKAVVEIHSPAIEAQLGAQQTQVDFSFILGNYRINCILYFLHVIKK